MRKSTLNLFGSEWFSIAISTLALAQVYILALEEFKIVMIRYVAELLSIIGISIFLIVFVLWAYRGLTIREKRFFQLKSLSRLSFTALIPIIGFISNYQLIYFFGLSDWTAALSLVNYYVNYVVAFILGLILGYWLYTKEIDPREINYAIVIPPLAVGTSVFLAAPLIKFYGGMEAQTMYFLVMLGLGIFFFLFIFIGSLALAGHVSTKVHEALPTTMLPVGIASLIIINLFSLSSFGRIDQIYIGLSTVKWVSVLLWGFEVWNFFVVLILIFTHPVRGTLGSWAYGFPLGLFATSTVRLLSFTRFEPLLWVYLAIAVIISILWFYGWKNTIVFLRRFLFLQKVGE